MSIHSARRQLKSTCWPAAILLLGIALLQAHSITLWQDWTGRWSGLAWSLLLELIALWLWYLAGSRGYRRLLLGRLALYVLGATTSALLLVGPLYQVGEPVFAQIVASRAARLQIEALDNEIVEADQSLTAFRQISLTRVGWQRKIDDAETQLENARRRRDSLRAREAGLPWLEWAPLLLQALSLVLFQIANVLAISRISTVVSRAGNGIGIDADAFESDFAFVSRRAVSGRTADEADDLARALQGAIKAQLESAGVSQAEFCRLHGLNPRDVSLLFHYFRNKSDGKRTVSNRFLESLKSRFLDPTTTGSPRVAEDACQVEQT